jgi:FkbM family methyltransferase
VAETIRRSVAVLVYKSRCRIFRRVRLFARKIARRFGYELVKKEPNALRTNVAQSYKLIADLGFKPETLIDVGVAEGTPELYCAFPEAHILMIEPIEEFKADIDLILAKRSGSFVSAAAGATSGSVAINVHPHSLDGSSLLSEEIGSEADGFKRTIDMVRIDDVIKEKDLHGPYFLKLDVQGAELDALEGCRETLLKTDVVAMEISLFKFMKTAPELFEVIAFMKNRGFVAFDIVLQWNRPLDNALGQIDIIFVQEKGPFRKDHSFATLDQLKAIHGEAILRGEGDKDD